MKNAPRKRKPPAKGAAKVPKKTGGRRKPLSFDVPADAVASRGSGWVYRSESLPRALPASPQRSLLPPSRAVGALPPAYDPPRGFLAAARDLITLPMELMLSIVLASWPTRR